MAARRHDCECDSPALALDSVRELIVCQTCAHPARAELERGSESEQLRYALHLQRLNERLEQECARPHELQTPGTIRAQESERKRLQARALRARNPQMSQRAIAAVIGASQSMVGQYLSDEMRAERLERAANWREENPEKRRAGMRRYRRENEDDIRLQQRAARRHNLPHRRAVKAAWDAENADHVRNYNASRSSAHTR